MERRQNFSGPRTGGPQPSDGPREMHTAICSRCGNSTAVPFSPMAGRPVYCRDCFTPRPRDFSRTFQTSEQVDFGQGVGNVLSEPTAFLDASVYAPEGPSLDIAAPEHKEIVITVEMISNEMINRLYSDPALIWSLTARRFEELVAELLDRKGYAVELTPPTRDGGFDIAAVRKDGVGSFLYLVECKRFVPPNKVGVQAVRPLYGVVEARRANGGVLVASTYFTDKARQFEQDVKTRLSLCDYDVLQSWICQCAGATPSIIS